MATPYWTRVIANAKKRLAKGQVPFTKEHMHLAFGWVTCACGEQDPRILRDRYAQPLDNVLMTLGGSFHIAIADQLPAMAGKILHNIETRAAELIAEYEAAHNQPPREDKNHDDE